MVHKNVAQVKCTFTNVSPYQPSQGSTKYIVKHRMVHKINGNHQNTFEITH
jgi:hypothetical protein